MKVIIAGSREIEDMKEVEAAIKESGFSITEVVSGTARGVDCLGEKWAMENDRRLAVFRAEWETLGKAAGFIRNRRMAEYADALIAVWDGKSKGTMNMIDNAEELDLFIYVKIPDRFSWDKSTEGLDIK